MAEHVSSSTSAACATIRLVFKSPKELGIREVDAARSARSVNTAGGCFMLRNFVIVLFRRGRVMRRKGREVNEREYIKQSKIFCTLAAARSE
mmetsp:Transcript_7972/g.15896  ORF Transcript_7972/g.15896 Transcript_7972/m.15896 type:complete len:92 (+) Transcript_7972:1426-1701(+)